MGNRAIVKQFGTDIGVYLHWNGGRDSVEAFLKYCEMRGFRGFDDSYGMARFCQVVGNFFGGGLSLGIERNVYMNANSSPGDNGIYEVKGWEIVGRYPKKPFEQRKYEMQKMLELIDSCQPRQDRLGKRYLRAKIVPTSQLRVGDTVYIYNDNAYDEPCSRSYKIVGIGEDVRRNGMNVKGIPYIDKWANGPDNINNYLTRPEYRATLKRRPKNGCRTE